MCCVTCRGVRCDQISRRHVVHLWTCVGSCRITLQLLSLTAGTHAEVKNKKNQRNSKNQQIKKKKENNKIQQTKNRKIQKTKKSEKISIFLKNKKKHRKEKKDHETAQRNDFFSKEMFQEIVQQVRPKKIRF